MYIAKINNTCIKVIIKKILRKNKLERRKVIMILTIIAGVETAMATASVATTSASVAVGATTTTIVNVAVLKSADEARKAIVD